MFHTYTVLDHLLEALGLKYVKLTLPILCQSHFELRSLHVIDYPDAYLEEVASFIKSYARY